MMWLYILFWSYLLPMIILLGLAVWEKYFSKPKHPDKSSLGVMIFTISAFVPGWNWYMTLAMIFISVSVVIIGYYEYWIKDR